MKVRKLTKWLLTACLVLPSFQMMANSQLSYIAAEKLEQHINDSAKEASFFYVSHSVAKDLNSVAISSWPKDIYTYGYSGKQPDLEDKVLLTRQKNNAYRLDGITWKTFPLVGKYVLLVRDEPARDSQWHEMRIYYLSDSVLSEAALVTDPFYQVLKSTQSQWRIARNPESKQSYNYWMIEQSFSEVSEAISNHLKSSPRLYTAKRYKLLSQDDSDAYKRYLSYLTPAYESAQKLDLIRQGMGMDFNSANDFIFGELLPNLSAFYNEYHDSDRFQQELFYNEAINTYRSLREGGDPLLRELRHLALTNQIDKQLEEQKKYTVLKDDYSTLTKMVATGDINKVRDALAKTSDINEHHENWTALNQASQDGFYDAVKLLVENGADLEVSSYGVTPLLSAARNNHVDIVRFLIEHGANVNTRDKQNLNSPLIYAAKKNYHEVVSLLLDNGADLWAESFSGDSAWEWAADKKHAETLKVLAEFDAQDGYKAYQALETGQLNSFRRAVTKMSNIYQLNPEDNSLSLLSTAAGKGNVDAVQLLIDYGMNVNFSARTSTSAMYQAAKLNHLDVVKLLVESGADTNLQFQYAPLHTAAYRGHMAILQYLLTQETTDPTIKAIWDETTPLHQAIEGNRVEAAKLLVSIPAYANLQTAPIDKFGNTPLIMLFKHKVDNREMFDLLMAQPWVNLEAKDSKGKTAFDYAQKAGLSDYFNELSLQ